VIFASQNGPEEEKGTGSGVFAVTVEP